MKPWQRGTIYALANSMGMVGPDKDDPLHDLVYGMTGKTSLSGSRLSDAEADAVIAELRIRQQGLPEPPPKKEEPEYIRPGGMTKGQRDKVWALMYQLAAYDTQPSTASLGERLCGILNRELHIDATAMQSMRWLTYQQGGRLIEVVKKYINSAKAKAQRMERGEADERSAGDADTG